MVNSSGLALESADVVGKSLKQWEQSKGWETGEGGGKAHERGWRKGQTRLFVHMNGKGQERLV